MRRLAPLLVLVAALLAGWARTPWAALAGPAVAACFLALERGAQRPAAPTRARRVR